MIKPVLIFKNLTVCLLLSVLFSLGACKKDKAQQPVKKNTSLFGQWYIPVKEGEQARYLVFSSDSTFILADVTYKNGNSTTVQYTGKFHTKGDGLNIVIAKKIVSEGSNVISTAPSNAQFYTNSAFVVDNYKLTINYKDNTGAAMKSIFSMVLQDKVI
ncbi:hypothetical protein [Mucilaginibacter sp. NFR10]|uniref:hypothetical protein n=1 Tax=Mucilaginibacter sp. NFR10 TaxID=1566292 RepID=UPI000871A6AD|nr:hypothetical protein [Mucilaginibacter sp. NFR10]SCW56327.1 hypothetical protein SAMN03159284_01909 [Mucilaginibacter sp. NFR10]